MSPGPLKGPSNNIYNNVIAYLSRITVVHDWGKRLYAYMIERKKMVMELLWNCFQLQQIFFNDKIKLKDLLFSPGGG